MAGTNTPGGGSTGYTISGITSVIFGTDGLLKSPAPVGSYAGTGYYIVESVDGETKSEPIWGENGTGIQTWRVMLVNGSSGTMTIQDDTGMTPPQIGSLTSVVDTGLIFPGNSNRSNAYSMFVIHVSNRFVRKGAEMRTVQYENLTLVDSQATV